LLLLLPHVVGGLVYKLFPQVSKFSLNEWQEIWDCCESNKLHSIYPTVGSVAHSKNMSHYDSVLINRLRIGHSRLTRTHILCGDYPPTCQETHLGQICRLAGHSYKISTVSSVAELFHSVDVSSFVRFIRGGG